MFRNYLTIAIRNLLRHRVYSAINILGLAVGMACCFLILLFVQDELSYDRFHEKADRIYVADVAGDWREEIIVVNGKEIHVYQNTARNPRPGERRLWSRQAYRRSKMSWNYYSP